MTFERRRGGTMTASERKAFNALGTEIRRQRAERKKLVKRIVKLFLSLRMSDLQAAGITLRVSEKTK